MQDTMAISAKKVAHNAHYEILHTIGEGHFAIGKLDQLVLTREVVAIKPLTRQRRASPESRNCFERLTA